jgi:hypothetical protein
MTLRDKAWQIPLRLSTGLYILNSGLSKKDADDVTAKSLQGMAAGTYPSLSQLDPQVFVKSLAGAEIGLGAAALLPLVPSRIVGAGLTAFGAGLVGLYLGTSGMRQEGSLRPTQEGIGLAKDIWLFAIGLSLLVGDRRAGS